MQTRKTLSLILVFSFILQLLGPAAAEAASFQYGGLRLDVATTTSAGATTVLTKTSKQVQIITGTLGQTIQLPAANTLSPGYWFTVSNKSTQNVAVLDAGGSLLQTMKKSTNGTFYVTGTGSAAGTWDAQLGGASLPLSAKGQVLGYDGTDPVAIDVAPGQTLVGNPLTPSGLESQDLADADMTRAAVHASVSANVISVFIKALNGTAIFTSNPAKITFRRANAIDGSQVTRTLIAQPQLDIPVGATLGLVNNAGVFYVYAVDNAGAVSIAVSASQLSEHVAQPLTTLSANSTDAKILYGTEAAGTYPVRLLGRVFVSNPSGTLAITNVSSFTTRSTQAAQINIGAQWVGQVVLSGGSWTFSANADPTSATTYLISSGSQGITPPTSNYAGFGLAVTPEYVYRIDALGAFNTNGGDGLKDAFWYIYNDVEGYAKELNYQRMTGSAGNVNASMPSVSGTFSPSSAGVRQMRIRTTATTNSIAASNLTFNVYRYPKVSTLSATLITKDPLSFASTQGTLTRVTTTPTEKGQYRSYQKNANAFTGTETAPTIAPSSAGFPIGAFNYASAGSGSLNISRYVVNIGKGIDPIRVKLALYKDAAHTKTLSDNKITNGVVEYGTVLTYSPITGNAVIDVMPINSGNTGNYAGLENNEDGTAGAFASSAYADITIADNPLAAGLTESADMIRLDGGNGQGGSSSGDTGVYSFLNVRDRRGDSISYFPRTATTADYFQVNKKGFYCAFWSDGFNAAGTMALTLNNDSQTSTALGAMTGNPFLSVNTTYGASTHANTNWCGVLDALSKIRAQGDVGRPRGAVLTTFTIAKVPSPLETVGAAGGGIGNVVSGAIGSNGSRHEAITWYNNGSIASTTTTGWASPVKLGTGQWRLDFAPGTFLPPPAMPPICQKTASIATNLGRTAMSNAMDTYLNSYLGSLANGSSYADSDFYSISCTQPR